uniref:Uncharacterized protein n=1 Tax=Anguilla anguilla TaxID=7936 RepID=A0A0E9VZG5_ANGAN
MWLTVAQTIWCTD